MKRDAIDFHVVEPTHLAIHERLVNWARWSYSRGGSSTSPMFRLYRPADEEDRDDLTRTAQPVDTLDAAKIQKGVTALPEPQMHALNWNYLRPSNPRRMAQKLGTSLDGLAELVRSGRQMLINRRV